MNRMKKLQRAKRLVQDDEEQLTRKPAKKRKSDIFENVWSLKPAIPDGDTIETLKEYVKRMAATLKKKPRDIKLHRDFLLKSFPLRRMQILDNPCPISEVLEMYPSLGNFVHVSRKPFLILHKKATLYNVAFYVIYIPYLHE